MDGLLICVQRQLRLQRFRRIKPLKYEQKQIKDKNNQKIRKLLGLKIKINGTQQTDQTLYKIFCVLIYGASTGCGFMHAQFTAQMYISSIPR